MRTDWTDMKAGSWVVLAALLAILAGAIWLGYEGWTMARGAQMSIDGYVAMTLGIVFSLVIGVGLMALVFYSSRAGYDEPPQLIERDRDSEQK